MPRTKRDTTTKSNGANLGFEEKLWAAADKMRGHMDAAEYKHVVLGLIFLKYISDAFEERHDWLLKEAANPKSEYYVHEERARYAVAEDRDEYTRRERLLGARRGPLVGPPGQRQAADHRQADRRRDGRHREGEPVAQGRAAQGLRPPRARQAAAGRTDRPDRHDRPGRRRTAARKDILGRVYEYFLGQFASAEGKGGGEFYTPQSVVKLLVEMIEPYKGRVYDPCCGSGGMFVQSEKFVLAHGGRIGDLAIYGQESNPTTWRLCKMNLAIRGIEGNLGRRECRHLPQRPAHRPEGRLHPGQSAVQHQRLGRRAIARGRALEVRRAAGRQRQLRLGAAHHPPPGPERHGGLRAGQRLDVVQHSPAKATSARPSSRPTWWTAWSRCPGSCSTPRRFPCASGSWRATRRTASSATAAGETLFIDARKMGTWLTAPTAN